MLGARPFSHLDSDNVREKNNNKKTNLNTFSVKKSVFSIALLPPKVDLSCVVFIMALKASFPLVIIFPGTSYAG